VAKPVRVMKPSLAHSPSWVCRLRGVIWRRSASSRPLQSRWGSVVIRAVTRCRRVGGWGPVRAGFLRWPRAGLAAGWVQRRSGDGDADCGDGGDRAGAAVVTGEVAGGGALDLAGAVTRPPGGQQGAQDRPADDTGQVSRILGADSFR
jgi:hypothetical protein